MVTKKQIAAARKMIFTSGSLGRNNLSKQLLAFLIAKSKLLTKEVCVTVFVNRDGFGPKDVNDLFLGTHNTNSNALFLAMGSKFNFSSHYGDFDPARSKGDHFSCAGQFPGWDPARVNGGGPDSVELTKKGMPLRFTFWLAKRSYSQKATLIKVTRKDLEKINLQKPGLYPSVEKSLEESRKRLG
jgi:hypothetical protein